MAAYYLCNEIYTRNVPLKPLNNMISVYLPTLILTALHLTNFFVLTALKCIPLSFLDLYTYSLSSWKTNFSSFSRELSFIIQDSTFSWNSFPHLWNRVELWATMPSKHFIILPLYRVSHILCIFL